MEPVTAAIAQLGERQTEVLKVPCSNHGRGIALIAQRQSVGLVNQRSGVQISLGALSKRTAFYYIGKVLTAQHGSMAERSKALDLGSSLFGGVGSNPTAIISKLA